MKSKSIVIENFLTVLFPKVKINPETNCWEWTKSTSGNNNYGVGWLHKKHIFIHRASYIYYIGEIPNNKRVLHKCDNPKCCSPFHLFLGTQKDNIKDAQVKGRFRISKHGTAWKYYSGCNCELCVNWKQVTLNRKTQNEKI